MRHSSSILKLLCIALCAVLSFCSIAAFRQGFLTLYQTPPNFSAQEVKSPNELLITPKTLNHPHHLSILECYSPIYNITELCCINQQTGKRATHIPDPAAKPTQPKPRLTTFEFLSYSINMLKMPNLQTRKPDKVLSEQGEHFI
jgi:hypothetical protein